MLFPIEACILKTLHLSSNRGVCQPEWYLHEDIGKTILAKASFASKIALYICNFNWPLKNP